LPIILKSALLSAQYSKHVFHQYTLILEGVDRDGLNQFLADHHIPSMIYYPYRSPPENV
jgi:dTDP-4-amino-4,6-dideoxygalactose transaminase